MSSGQAWWADKEEEEARALVEENDKAIDKALDQLTKEQVHQLYRRHVKQFAEERIRITKIEVEQKIKKEFGL